MNDLLGLSSDQKSIAGQVSAGQVEFLLIDKFYNAPKYVNTIPITTMQCQIW